MQHGQALLAAGLVATVLMLVGVYHFYYIDGYGYGFFMSAFGYSLVAVAFSLLVMAALSPNSWLHVLKIPGAHHLAVWSYSIYLTHKAVAVIVKNYAKTAALSPSVVLLATTVLSVLVGALLYRVIEAPFMALRERWFPSTFGAARLPVAQPLVR
jgi:peptidoglycan/LPS O-acetylase OafA/YrhL